MMLFGASFAFESIIIKKRLRHGSSSIGWDEVRRRRVSLVFPSNTDTSLDSRGQGIQQKKTSLALTSLLWKHVCILCTYIRCSILCIPIPPKKKDDDDDDGDDDVDDDIFSGFTSKLFSLSLSFAFSYFILTVCILSCNVCIIRWHIGVRCGCGSLLQCGDMAPSMAWLHSHYTDNTLSLL